MASSIILMFVLFTVLLGYVLYVRGVFRKLRLPLLGPPPSVDSLRAAADRESEKAENLRAVLEATKALEQAKAESARLAREIAEVSRGSNTAKPPVKRL